MAEMVGHVLDPAAERFRDEGLEALWDAVAALMSQRDEPDHTRLRALVQKAFYRTSVERWTPTIDRQIRSLLAPALARGEMDFIADFAIPPPILICPWCGGRLRLIATVEDPPRDPRGPRRPRALGRACGSRPTAPVARRVL